MTGEATFSCILCFYKYFSTVSCIQYCIARAARGRGLLRLRVLVIFFKIEYVYFDVGKRHEEEDQQ
eukprot:SAG11_NODE_2656_length_3121_cov_2.233212_3_plen_66_part_00